MTRWNLTAVAAIAIVASGAALVRAAVEDDLRDGDRFFESQEWSRAAAAYDRAIAKAPGQVSAEAYGKRAAVFIILKDYPGGQKFFDNLANATAAPITIGDYCFVGTNCVLLGGSVLPSYSVLAAKSLRFAVIGIAFARSGVKSVVLGRKSRA